ncbi:hypothetical protein JW948_19280 [bacterium]|nr:hypothetical protein [bacterium]
MENRSQLFWGSALIVLGVLFLFGNLTDISMDRLWPAFPMLVGLSFWAAYLQKRGEAGILMPGTILVVISLLFFFCANAGWDHMARLWPVFVLAPAAGFVAMYFGGNRDKNLLFPAGILGLIGSIFLAVGFGLSNYWPLLMILAGVLLILTELLSGKNNIQKNG